MEFAANGRCFPGYTSHDRILDEAVDEQGPDALLRICEPVNKFPEFVSYAVRRLKTLCPQMGKVKIAQTLARAGLHLGATTVGRMLNDGPKPVVEPEMPRRRDTKIVAKFPDHAYHIDLTAIPTQSGFWAPWFPGSLPQCWPFCWWVLAVLDHFSRRIVAVGVFANKPDCRTVFAWTLIPQTRAQSPHLRSRQHLRLRRLSELGQAERNSCALRRGGQARKHCGYRAILPHP